MVIQFNTTSLPYRYAKLSKIVFGIVREFGIDELRSVSALQELDPISSELAINTLDWTLDSAETVDYLFQLKQPVEAYDGDALIGVFYIDSSKRLAPQVYDVSCIDAIGVLDESDFAGGMYSGQNAKALVTSILNGDFGLTWPASLNSAAVTGYIAPCTRREAIQQIAFAVGAVVDTSGSDSVVVSVLPSSSPATIPKSRAYAGPSTETGAIVTAVKVTAHTYTQGSGGNGDDIVEVGGVKYVHTTAVTTITNPSVTASDKQNVIEVKDATLVNSSNASAVAQRVYNDALRRVTLSQRIVMDGEKPGDYVTAYTPYDATITGNIISMDIRLSGIAAADCKIKGA